MADVVHVNKKHLFDLDLSLPLIIKRAGRRHRSFVEVAVLNWIKARQIQRLVDQGRDNISVKAIRIGLDFV